MEPIYEACGHVTIVDSNKTETNTARTFLRSQRRLLRISATRGSAVIKLMRHGTRYTGTMHQMKTRFRPADAIRGCAVRNEK